MIDWIKENNELLMIAGGAIAAVCTAAWAVYRYFDEKKTAREASKAPAPQTYQAIQIYGIPFAEHEAALRRREEELRKQLSPGAGAEHGKEKGPAQELDRLRAELDRSKQRVETLTRLLNEIKTDLVPKELDSDSFPPSLRVRSFLKGTELTVNVLPDRVSLIVRRVVGVVWSAFAAFVLVALLRLPPLLGTFVFVAIFYALFWRYYVRFNFKKRTISLISPGAAVWGLKPHPAEVTARADNGQWRGEVRVEGLRIASTEPRAGAEEARAELLPFARALNFALGIPVISLDQLVQSQPGTTPPDLPASGEPRRSA
jgi:hypothetical protein